MVNSAGKGASEELLRRRLAPALAVIACLLIAGAWQHAHIGATATKVTRYVPTATLPDTGRTGYCWSASIAAPYRTDTWRCMEGNAIYDPCFSLPGQLAVVCGVNPAARDQGFQLKLTKPLPQVQAPAAPPQEPWAWLVELEDGTFCAPFTGTRPFIAGEAAFYGCRSSKRGEDKLLLGDLDNQHRLWTAKLVNLVKSGSDWIIQSTETVPIKRVWQ